MADMTDMGGLLGLLDPEMLKQLAVAAQQFGPSAADQQTAKMHAFLAAGLGTLANSYKPPSMAVGQGGLLGMQGYNDELTRLAQQRQQSMQSMSSLMPMMMQANIMKSLQGVNVNGRYGDTTTPANPNAALNTTSAVGTMADLAGQPDLAAVANAQQGAYSAGAPQPQAAPTTTQGGANTGMQLLDEAINVGVPRSTAMMTLATGGVPALAKVTAEYGKLQSVRPGGAVGGLDPTTGQWSNRTYNAVLPAGMRPGPGNSAEDVPGAAEGFMRQALRGPQAEASVKMIPVPIGNGQTMMMTEADANNYIKTRTLPSDTAPAPSAPPAPSGYTAAQDAAQPAAIAALKASPKSIIQVDRAGSIAPNPTPRVATNNALGGPGVTASPAALAGATEVAKGRAEYGLKNEAMVDDAASAAQMDMARNTEIRNLITHFTPGAITPIRGEVGAVAASLGVPENIVSGIAGGSVPAIQAMGKLVVDGAFDSAKQAMSGGGRVTQAEILLKAKNSPNVPMTKEAINAMLDFKDGVNTWLMDRQQGKNEWSKAGNDPSQFAGDWNKNHPLTNYVPSAEKLNAALFPNAESKPTTATNGWSIKRIQ